MHIVLASALGAFRTITLGGAGNSSVSVLHLAAIIKRRVAACKAESSVSWPNPLQKSQFPPQIFDRGDVADVPKKAGQAAAFS